MDEPVAVLFDRLGPYHWARLEAAAAELSIFAVETCTKPFEYGWDKIEQPSRFKRAVLFADTDGDSQNISSREIEKRVSAALEQLAPVAVAIPGWSTPAALSALSWCLSNGRAAIVMSESTAWDAPRRPLREAVKRHVVSLFSAGLVAGRPQADYLSSLGIPKERVFFGYDVVDNNYFAENAAAIRSHAPSTRARLGLPDHYFLASSRFIAKKNLPRLLEALALHLKEARSDGWPLVLLGDGPQKKLLIDCCQRLDLEIGRSVFFPGFKQYQQLPDYYALADVFIHASTTEQWGLVVNEAMACKLPVLVSNRCGCVADLVREGENGFTFDPFDADELAARMKQFVRADPNALVAMGEASERVIAPYSPAAFAAGFSRALDVAVRSTRIPGNIVDRFLLKMLIRSR